MRPSRRAGGATRNFLPADYLVTVHRRPIAALSEVRQRYAGGASAVRAVPDFIFYLVINALADEIFPIIDRLADQIEDTETEILQKLSSHDLPKLLRIKRTLMTLGRALAPERDVLSILLRRGGGLITDRTARYLRDVYENQLRANDGSTWSAT